MTETYSKSVDFGGQIAPGQFHTEIQNSSIVTALTGVTVVLDVVSVIFVSTISGAEKITLDGLVAAHVPDPTNFLVSVPGYIDLTSTLADSGAIVISASNAAGGIDIDAGTGGIAVDTTNAIHLGAGAAIDIFNTAGNISLDTPALIDLNAISGINIGNDADAAPVNIGTSASVRTVTIGNSTGASAIIVNSGTGDITMTTQDAFTLTANGTAANAVRIDTGGGIDVDATGTINLASGSAAGGAVTLDAAFNNGGITISSGSQGIAINSGTGLIGIGHWSAADIQIGTSATARTITIGNTTGATAVNINTGTGDFNVSSQDAILMDCAGVLELNSSGGIISIGNDAVNQNINLGTLGTRVISIGNSSSTTAVNISCGTGGIVIGGDSNGGEIHIANVAFAKTVIVGNNTGATRLITRWGTSANIKTQVTETSYSNADQTATMTNLRTGILRMTPTTTRTITLPTAANVVADYSGYQVSDCIDFVVINEGTTAGTRNIVIAMGTGGTAVGYMTVNPYSNGTGTYFYSGSGVFRLKFTNVTASSEAYTVYRIG